ncbi:hypothetical protein [Vitiosangium sp. GDMCC 1.1324]|uniref:hypothetical protein n=1 Tax=Vitiosangium sp. (strain GDMCC 1.1324) TaxID=2138576 RepID=UPI00130E4EF1|nr:hypothetical protein [Vitiosangium sp. GDMCC 1.1324]
MNHPVILEGLAAKGKLLVKTKVPKSLDQRLKGIELTSSDPDTQGRAKALREKLRA